MSFFSRKNRELLRRSFRAPSKQGGGSGRAAGRCPGHLGINNDNGGRSQQTRKHWRGEFSKLPPCVGVPTRAGVARYL